MKTNIKDGIYIIDAEGGFHRPEEWKKQSDPTVAKFVLLIADKCALVIAKNDLDGEFKFDDAQKAASAFGEGWRCPTRHEAIEMYDARFRGLDEALKLIGGTPLDKNGWRWTCEQDTDPEYNSGSAFFFNGSHGGVDNSSKYYSFSVRPVSAFEKELSRDKITSDVQNRINAGFTAGARTERHELLRWRDPKEELPKGSEKVLVKYGLANGTIKYGIGEINMVYKFLGNSPTFIIEGSCHREVALWRPIEEE